MNHLSGETSPYLLQHARNPVDWHPWTDEALQKARQEHKLLIISIGYAACHWCHVMEKESFEDPDIARYTNEFFVSVKVDREERPDIDQVYMPAAYAVSGRGGWPLNVIALPDGRPVYAGTYFRKSDWFYLLRELSATWKNNPEEMIRQAESIQRRMKAMEAKPVSASPPAPLLQEGGVTERFRVLKPSLDFENGGTAGAPKFPMPGLLQLILHLARLSSDSEIRTFIRLTLEKMANGGIFDHLGGGFSRYSTDDRWHVPHFEKMLYDNAQLVSLYSQAFQSFRDPLYRDVVSGTLQFIERELTSPEGLFYSSIDADSEGKEGVFYTWTLAEVRHVLGEKAGEFVDFYNITEEGNWENGLNVLWNPCLAGRQADSRIWGEATRNSRDILFRIREKRIRPALDNKKITSWNAMMISGYLDAYRALGEERFLEKAVNAAAVLAKGWRENERLTRLQDPELRITDYGLREASHEKRELKAFLDDYAFTISAFISMYQCVFDPSWLDLAEQMLNHVMSHFRDDATGLFWFTSDEDPALISRSMELSDNVIPSSNAVMANNLFLLGHLLGREPWIGFAEMMSARLSHQVDSDPSFYAFWADLHLRLLKRPFEVSIVGPEWKSVLQKFQKYYLPDVIFSGGVDENVLDILKGKAVEGKTVIYVCRDKTCSEPLTDPGDVLRALADDEIEPH